MKQVQVFLDIIPKSFISSPCWVFVNVNNVILWHQQGNRPMGELSKRYTTLLATTLVFVLPWLQRSRLLHSLCFSINHLCIMQRILRNSSHDRCDFFFIFSPGTFQHFKSCHSYVMPLLITYCRLMQLRGWEGKEWQSDKG